ncbi:XRE family transcriptional regulator [Nostoc sp. ATCC 43529]|nr:XRE family transcriptional regulator [Nostoc sp. ATCC 43529]
MAAMEKTELAELIRETRMRLELSQVKFAEKLGVSFHSVNRWENGRTRPLPLVMKQIEALLYSLGDRGEDLLARYFSSRRS